MGLGALALLALDNGSCQLLGLKKWLVRPSPDTLHPSSPQNSQPEDLRLVSCVPLGGGSSSAGEAAGGSSSAGEAAGSSSSGGGGAGNAGSGGSSEGGGKGGGTGSEGAAAGGEQGAAADGAAPDKSEL